MLILITQTKLTLSQTKDILLGLLFAYALFTLPMLSLLKKYRRKYISSQEENDLIDSIDNFFVWMLTSPNHAKLRAVYTDVIVKLFNELRHIHSRFNTIERMISDTNDNRQQGIEQLNDNLNNLCYNLVRYVQGQTTLLPNTTQQEEVHFITPSNELTPADILEELQKIKEVSQKLDAKLGILNSDANTIDNILEELQKINKVSQKIHKKTEVLKNSGDGELMNNSLYQHLDSYIVKLQEENQQLQHVKNYLVKEQEKLSEQVQYDKETIAGKDEIIEGLFAELSKFRDKAKAENLDTEEIDEEMLKTKKKAKYVEHRKNIEDALIAAFPDRTKLEMMLKHQLERELNCIAEGGNLKETVFKLLKASIAEGWTEELVKGAHKANSGNSELKEVLKLLQIEVQI